MERPTIFLCLFLACVRYYYRNVAYFSIFSTSHRYFIFQILPTTFGNDINRTHENLVKTIDTAIETFQEKVNPILRDVLDVANKMKQEGQDRMESLRSKMEDVLSNVCMRLNTLDLHRF